MDKSQADAIAQAILTPDPKTREALHKRRAQEAWLLAEKRKVAWLTLVGFAIGAAAAHFYLGERFTVGGLWGGLVGAAIGWVWIGWRSRRRAALQFRRKLAVNTAYSNGARLSSVGCISESDPAR
jgi:hypothetical protein